MIKCPLWCLSNQLPHGCIPQYATEVTESSVTWCNGHHLQLNMNIINELIVDFFSNMDGDAKRL